MSSTTKLGCVNDLGSNLEQLTFADLHIHSKYSRATSPQMDVTSLHYWAKRKGIGLMGTGDFTHPNYFQELKEKLEPDETGFYKVKGQNRDVLFLPTAETSHIYKQDGKCRRVHMLMMARNLETVNEINKALAARGNIASDGRPILGLSAKNLCKLVREIDEKTIMVPAHIWTPWFSVLGEKSGFDSLQACFEEELDMICGIETGLSSDPEMNWRLSQLDPYSIISNSDAHSPSKIGRECNAFTGTLTWDNLYASLRNKKKSQLKFTVEFFPEEGKYHWPGHLKCKQAISPSDYKELNGLCPICKKELTAGVASRAEMLADRPEGYRPKQAAGSVHLVPLDEIISEAIGKGPATKSVQQLSDQMLSENRDELRLLIQMPESELIDLAGPRIAEAIMRMRRGEVTAQAGYDGVYGKIKLFEEQEKVSIKKTKQTKQQLSLIK